MKPLVELYKNEIEHAEPVGDFVNDNIMVTTQLLCLEDGQRVRDLGANLGMGYHRSLLLRYLDTFPRPAGVPEWPAILPDPTPEMIDSRHRHGRRCRTALLTRSRSRSASTPDAGVDQVVFGLLSSTMDRELAFETIETFGKHVLPALRHAIPCTAAHASGKPRSDRADRRQAPVRSIASVSASRRASTFSIWTAICG